jgi:predicted ArsR family transcriptional regulator
MAILGRLKRDGPQDADTLARVLGVTAMAVRQHLYALANDGLVAFEPLARGRGRPAKMWHPTAAADAHFPDGHATLSLELIESARAVFGEAGLDRLITVRTARQKAAYGARLAGARSLKARLERLARIRTAEGYMAEVRPAERGGFLLIENHCPVCEAARACAGLCRQELDLFRDVLGPGVAVERVDHIAAGARRCAYRVDMSA